MKVKICGVTSRKDAEHAASVGADYIGIIFAKNSKRAVSLEQALDIAKVSKSFGAEPVAVFVEQTAEEIESICEKTQITTVQLHGEKSGEIFNKLYKKYKIFYGTNFLDPQSPYDCEYILYDNKNPGSGQFDKDRFKAKLSQAKKCLIAGGLTPENVSEVIQHFEPYAVDVATGVEYLGSTEKDPKRVEAFINKAKSTKAIFEFGGQFVPEILIKPLEDLERHWKTLREDEDFLKEFQNLLETFAGRETPITEVKNFAKAINGPRVFLKREDLLHTGAHKINNALGQCLIAKYMGKKRIVAETGAGQHGVAVATACAHLGLECVVYMGAKDVKRQKANVEKILLLGAEVVSVTEGAATLKVAVNEALRDWAAHYETSHYCLGSAVGPHPFPEIVREFQSVISLELKKQLKKLGIDKPDLLIACVGGGSNAIGFFHHFIEDKDVKLIGVEAGGQGQQTGQHASRFLSGTPGVFHGFCSYFLQDGEGQILPTHSISAGLDYPGVGPDHAKLYQNCRAFYSSASDEEALKAFYLLTKTEGIIPALESSHALAYLMKIAPQLNRSDIVVVNLSGRGDKDLKAIENFKRENT